MPASWCERLCSSSVVSTSFSLTTMSDIPQEDLDARWANVPVAVAQSKVLIAFRFVEVSRITVSSARSPDLIAKLKVAIKHRRGREESFKTDADGKNAVANCNTYVILKMCQRPCHTFLVIQFCQAWFDRIDNQGLPCAQAPIQRMPLRRLTCLTTTSCWR